MPAVALAKPSPTLTRNAARRLDPRCPTRERLSGQEELTAKHGITASVICQDLTAANAAQNVFEQVAASGQSVDLLINNAGFGGIGKFHERPLADELSMIQLNIMALTALTHWFLPGMIERGRGKVLNVSSTASLMSGYQQAVYFDTKAFVTSFSYAIAKKLEQTGVTVTALPPGPTETKFGDISGMGNTAAFNQTASARSVAEAGYQAMLAGKLSTIAGMPLLPTKLVLTVINRLQTPK